MNTFLATLCLNEMEWLPKLYEQHKDWPGLTKWVFVEAADWVYADCNPSMVTGKGLSVDGTSEYLQELVKKDSKVEYIPHGLTGHDQPDQGKCAARQRYLDVAEAVKPDFVFVVDADEFYTYTSQLQIQTTMERLSEGYTSFCFPHLHPWRPPSIADQPLFQYQVTGGFWDIGFVRGWRWQPGCCYRANHNHVEDANGVNLKETASGEDAMADYRQCSQPVCIHMGFTASGESRKAKHDYYAARGEGKGDNRNSHVISRAAWEDWKPKGRLPKGAIVTPYSGFVPECFQ